MEAGERTHCDGVNQIRADRSTWRSNVRGLLAGSSRHSAGDTTHFASIRCPDPAPMTLYGLTFSAAASFLFLCLVFWPLEAAFPAKKGQRFFRPAFVTDLCFFLGQYLLWSGVVLFLLTRFGGWLD